MLNSIQQVERFEIGTPAPAVLFSISDQRRETYEQNQHRVYSLAFWMTDSELAAEEFAATTFIKAFEKSAAPTADEIDEALVAELRKSFEIGDFTLDCAPSADVKNVRSNTLRVDLERAVVELPATEKLIFLMHDVERYQHSQIARLLGIQENESRLGLHQARLRMRELLAN